MSAGHEVTAAVVVSEEVDDLILGLDWMSSLAAGGRSLRIPSVDIVRACLKECMQQRACHFSWTHNQCAINDGHIVAPQDVRRLGRGFTISRNRDFGRVDFDEGRGTSIGRAGDERQ